MIRIPLFILSAICLVSCAGGASSSEREEKVSTIETVVSEPEEEMIEVVVDDQTGEILGIKANEVGDFYIINPSDEEMIPMEGHSTKMVRESELF